MHTCGHIHTQTHTDTHAHIHIQIHIDRHSQTDMHIRTQDLPGDLRAGRPDLICSQFSLSFIVIFQFLAPGAPGGFPGRSRSWGSIKNEPKFSHIPLTSQSKFTRSTFSVNKFKKQFIRITFYKNCSENAPISPAPPGARRCTYTYTYTFFL